MVSDNILFHTDTPVTKVIFLYENKNNQELKEFCVERNSSTEDILNNVLASYKELNKCCDEHRLPPREGSSKSCTTCRWCDYRNMCWVV